jgi:hypothetical protein
MGWLAGASPERRSFYHCKALKMVILSASFHMALLLSRVTNQLHLSRLSSAFFPDIQ